jgi:uncharacterized RDD family membrane protein YckC
MKPPSRPLAEPAALGWRLLAMLYDLLPVLALWMVASAVLLAVRGGAVIVPWSPVFWLQALLLWILTGAYAVESWRRGGQTLGMRPWRLRVVDGAGETPTRATLWARYAAATLSLATFGLGFAWSLLDRERRGWHDLWTDTRLVRLQR